MLVALLVIGRCVDVTFGEGYACIYALGALVLVLAAGTAALCVYWDERDRGRR